jgi:hypothetical protein
MTAQVPDDESLVTALATGLAGEAVDDARGWSQPATNKASANTHEIRITSVTAFAADGYC